MHCGEADRRLNAYARLPSGRRPSARVTSAVSATSDMSDSASTRIQGNRNALLSRQNAVAQLLGIPKIDGAIHHYVRAA